MFAFAIWDAKERRLFIARDRVGVKPLYWVKTPRGLLFASELRALLISPAVPRDMDHEALSNYLRFLYSPGEETPFAHIRKLRPGCMLLGDARETRVERWWAPPVGGRPSRPQPNANAAARDLAQLLQQVVVDQTIADVPVGAFLSGGQDSTAVVAMMKAGGHAPAQCYCVAFDGPGMEAEGFGDDWSYARDYARAEGIGLTRVVAHPPEPEDIFDLIRIVEEPQADFAALLVREICAGAPRRRDQSADASGDRTRHSAVLARGGKGLSRPT
jgi:asparagine synthase (glutamine-hydrolysing)